MQSLLQFPAGVTRTTRPGRDGGKERPQCKEHGRLLKAPVRYIIETRSPIRPTKFTYARDNVTNRYRRVAAALSRNNAVGVEPIVPKRLT